MRKISPQPSIIEKFDPVSFAYVMASGSVALALHVTGFTTLAQFFLIVGLIGYIALIFLFCLRSYFIPKLFSQEIAQLHNQFKYFTFSAGSNALASVFALRGNDYSALVLGAIGTISCVLFVYAIFFMQFYKTKESLQSVSPVWLIMAIALNSVGIVTSILWKNDVLTNDLWLITALCFWTFGVVIYSIFMTLNIYRLLFFALEAKHFNPAYWTCMGAAAIAIVDGASIINVKNCPTFLEAVTPFIAGLILILWCWATAWIPILCLMGYVKYRVFKTPFRYEAPLWAIVFPLGMYTTATYNLGSVVGLTQVQAMVPVWLWISVLSWVAVAAVKISQTKTLFSKD